MTEELFPEVVKLSAVYDKATKTTWRYNIEANDFGISGCLYIKKIEDVKDKDVPEKIRIKVKG